MDERVNILFTDDEADSIHNNEVTGFGYTLKESFEISETPVV
jgi:hypothetical protein